MGLLEKDEWEGNEVQTDRKIEMAKKFAKSNIKKLR